MTGLWKIQYSMAIVSLIIAHYQQRAHIFLCNFNKTQPSPTDQKRNWCLLHVQQKRVSLIVQTQNWCCFLIIISHKQKREFSDLRWQKASCTEINSHPNKKHIMQKGILGYWKIFRVNIGHFILSNQSHLFLVVIAKAAVIFCLKDLNTQLWHLLGLMRTSEEELHRAQPNSSQDAAN